MSINNTNRFKPMLLVLSIIFLTTLACGQSTSQTGTTPISTTVSTGVSDLPTSTIEATTSIDTPQPSLTPEEPKESKTLYLTDVVEQYGYLLTALTVEDPTTPGMFYEAEDGKKLVAVEIILGNISGNPLSVNPLYATLVDTEGFIYQPELAGREDQILTITLSSGEKAKGWIAFEVPENVTLSSIKYAIELFGSRVLQSSLTPPPDGYLPDTSSLSILPPSPETALGGVNENYGYSLSATNVENPTTPGMFYTVREGFKLVAVEIILGNESGIETLSANPLYAVLLDDSGYVYEPELAGRDGQIVTADLGIGERVKGWVAFEIPENATPASIKYLVEIFSDNYLHVSLID